MASCRGRTGAVGPPGREYSRRQRAATPVKIDPMDACVRRERYVFGRFELQPEERRLYADNVAKPVTGRAFDLLVALAKRAGEVVTKDELLSRVWPKLVVEETNLQVQVSTLRKILGAEAIATVARRGYRLVPRVTTTSAPSDPGQSRKHNLPRPLTRFISSAGQIDACARMLDEARLVTLTGSGGSGKTRLLQETARSCLGRFDDGAWFVGLAAISDAGQLPQAVAAALGVTDTEGGDLAEIVRQYVKGRRMLLLLDNCEHIVQGCAEFARQLLQFSPHLRMLATSREPLRLAGEATLRLEPLSVPDPDAAASAESLSSFDAVRLFVDRAAAAQPGFALTDANASSVARICRRLDGIPLAIELAAPLVRVMSVAAIAERIPDRIDLLKAADPTTEPRHRTLQAALDWSYELLEPSERIVLRRMSIFSGSFTLEAAEAAGACGELRAADLCEILSRLVEKSLIVFESKHDRYRLLETVRQYASSRAA